MIHTKMPMATISSTDPSTAGTPSQGQVPTNGSSRARQVSPTSISPSVLKASRGCLRSVCLNLGNAW